MPSSLRKWAALLTLLATIPVNGSTLEPVRTGQESFISRAIFSGAKLWLLTDAGSLSTITEGENQRVEIPLPEPALDLWRQGGDPMVLTGGRSDDEFWTLRKLSHGVWTATAKVPSNGDQFVGVSSFEGVISLLTSRRLIDIVGSDQRAVAVAWPHDQRLAGISSLLVTHDSVLVGFNVGEWGGGLRRIDRNSGTTSIIESNTSGELCGGPLNTDCDPVNGIAMAPWNVDCTAVAIGLVHRMTHGSIVKVCGSAVDTVYVKPKDDHYSTVPFFGIVASGATLWAVSTDGIYQIEKDGVAKFSSLPAFKRIGNASVSFALPDVVLVLTDVNKRRSVSGSVPIIVSR